MSTETNSLIITKAQYLIGLAPKERFDERWSQNNYDVSEARKHDFEAWRSNNRRGTWLPKSFPVDEWNRSDEAIPFHEACDEFLKFIVAQSGNTKHANHNIDFDQHIPSLEVSSLEGLDNVQVAVSVVAYLVRKERLPIETQSDGWLCYTKMLSLSALFDLYDDEPITTKEVLEFFDEVTTEYPGTTFEEKFEALVLSSGYEYQDFQEEPDAVGAVVFNNDTLPMRVKRLFALQEFGDARSILAEHCLKT